MTEQTAEDRARRILRIALGAESIALADLPIRASSRWLEQLQAAMTKLGDAVPDERATTALFELNHLTVETAIDLIVAFDEAGEHRIRDLGGRDWVLDNATQSQIRETLDTLREASVPFGGDVEAMTLTRLLVRAAALSAQSSTSGLLPTGSSIPTRSRPSSPRRNSRTSGSRARRGSAGRPASA